MNRQELLKGVALSGAGLVLSAKYASAAACVGLCSPRPSPPRPRLSQGAPQGCEVRRLWRCRAILDCSCPTNSTALQEFIDTDSKRTFAYNSG